MQSLRLKACLSVWIIRLELEPVSLFSRYHCRMKVAETFGDVAGKSIYDIVARCSGVDQADLEIS